MKSNLFIDVQTLIWNDISRKEVIRKLESVRYKLLTEF